MKDRKAWLSVMGNSAGLALIVGVELLIAGPASLIAVHLPITLAAATIGVWLFYVQHQFEGAYWTRNPDWSAHEAALRGSSHLDLPPVLRWFTANIGAHHVHHVGSKIPFYRLPQVLKDHPELKEVSRITLWDAFKAVRLSLWDEAAGRLVSFREERMARMAGLAAA
jgi:omega-6 fatty acid desaturase (delta-12 desaturase)